MKLIFPQHKYLGVTMNDPWDVKSVRHSGQYVSCMRHNGVPLLPPVLSKECRKEMQYYKLLAREVEKRLLYQIDSDNEDTTDAPDLPEYEQSFENISPKHRPIKDACDDISDPALESIEISPTTSSPNLDLDLSKTTKNIAKTTKTPKDLPERDYNCVTERVQKVITKKHVITDVETCRSLKKKEGFEEVSNISWKTNEDPTLDTLTEFHPIGQDGPSSLSSKSFTGSLNDIYSENIKEQLTPGLTRQRSYTLLKPSPQLLAHLEVQSINTGVEMTSISMSESLSNLSTPHRKRRNWDLETAKEKWSSMATELKQNNFICGINKKNLKQHKLNKSPSRLKSVAPTAVRKNGVTPKVISKSEISPKSEPLPKKKYHSPVRTSSNRTFIKEPASPKPCEKNINQTIVTSEAEDPATRVRELYEKIQKQQLIQMATLVEKQKREQMLLQQVFEEQNNLLYKQLKNICPKSPIEAKQAWGVSQPDGDRGPVSLSQLINYKSPEQSVFNSPLSSTLTDTNQYLNECDKVLKQSRGITGSIKKDQTKSSMNGSQIKSPSQQPDGSRTRTHSPAHIITITPRRLNYDTSSERECDPLLTDRTNDTLADLNVTFPSDTEADGGFNKFNNSLLSQLSKEYKSPFQKSDNTTSGIHSKATEDAIRNMEKTIQESMCRSGKSTRLPAFRKEPTPEERAAATKIVAHAKGYLVRRLMKTDRVQTTVQTIKDALLCALQLHQDREGIRGADVDLHRRLIQQITAACYSLHETFIASSAAERCTLISTDRSRRRSLAAKQPQNSSYRQSDIMSQSHTGVFPIRAKRAPPSPMTQSNYETFSADKLSPVSRRYMSSPRRRPWR